MSDEFENRLLSHLIDGAPLSADEQLALENSPEAKATRAELRSLFDDLAVARRSQPSAAATARYADFFTQIKTTPNPALISSLVETARTAASDLFDSLQATLAWDSRQQIAMQGARSAAGQSYRLLYSTAAADIEMLVEPEGNLRHITGEVLPLDDVQGRHPSSPISPLLLHLLQPQSGVAFADATSDAEGAFRLAPIAPGHYKLLVTPRQGAVLEVPSLEIT